MVGVRMCLQTIPHLMQWPAVDLRCCHDVRPKINQHLVVDQRCGAFAEAPRSCRARLGAVSAAAKSLWESICGSGSKECDDGLRGHFFKNVLNTKNIRSTGALRLA
jgi:hypothetical protein